MNVVALPLSPKKEDRPLQGHLEKRNLINPRQEIPNPGINDEREKQNPEKTRSRNAKSAKHDRNRRMQKTLPEAKVKLRNDNKNREMDTWSRHISK